MNEIDKYILENIGKRRISGEELSKNLNISRTAVWKRIKKLENLGYKISHDKKGYLLEERTEFLLPYELNLKTQWLGQNYIFFHTINSTNIYAKENELPDGTVILAENQTAGKGRKGRKWISIEGKGLYFSIVLKRDISPTDLLVYSLLFPVAVRKAIVQKTNLPVRIKWPNDLYINNKKLAGFLIETEIEGNSVTKLIAGIGININQTEEDLEEVRNIATSLRLEYGKKINRKEIFADILQSIEKEIDNFDKSRVVKEVEENLLWKGEKIKLIDEDIEGRLIGLNEFGGICILTDKGLKDFYSGDITVRRIE